MFRSTADGIEMPGLRRQRLTRASKKNVVSVDVVEGRNLASKDSNGRSDPYCIVRYDAREWQTAVVWKDLNPVWNEAYLIPVNETAQAITFEIWDRDFFNRDDFMGMVTVYLSSLKDEKLRDEWFKLEKRKGSSGDDDEVSGEIHLRLQYRSAEREMKNELLSQLTLADYNKLNQFMSSLNVMQFVHMFDHVTLTPSDDTLKSMLIFSELHFNPLQEENNCLRYLIKKEVNACKSAETLFRSNSISSKYIAAYMRYYGDEYLLNTLSELTKQVCENFDEAIEIDPGKAQKEIDVQESCNKLIEITEQFLSAIINSISLVPSQFRILCFELKAAVEERFPGKMKEKKHDSDMDISMSTVAVGALFFLRFICPAIISPFLFGLVEKNPAPHSHRTLTLITKVLQNLANGTKMREESMQPINVFLANSFQKVQLFLDSLAKPIAGVSMLRREERSAVAKRYTEADLVSVCYDFHDHFAKSLDTMCRDTEADSGEDSKEFSIAITAPEEKESVKEAMRQAKAVVFEIGASPEKLLEKRKEKEKAISSPSASSSSSSSSSGRRTTLLSPFFRNKSSS